MRDSYTFDSDLEFKDAGLVAASAAAEVDSSAAIIDLGLGLVDGKLVIDVSAIEIASNDELYKICFQISSSASFASVIEETALIELGALEVLRGDQDSSTGRYILAVRNEINGTVYRYARVYTVISGAIATGINYTAFLAKH